MYPILKSLATVGVVAAGMLRGQGTDFTVEGRPVQIHGFASQGFMISGNNNYLTMPTSTGSFAFTDLGASVSVQLTDKFRIGAQLYDRNVGQLGNWYPELDWASADYKFRDWLGIRAGKIKTVMGLYNDTQDLESLHTWALLPQSMYPVDLRSIISHIGGDVYGDIGVKRLGSLSYTVHAGLIPDDPHGGYFYGSKAYGQTLTTLDARAEGADLRWNTPVRGLLAGSSYFISSFNSRAGDALGSRFSGRSKKYYASQFYAQYGWGNVKLDAEYRRTYDRQDNFYNSQSVGELEIDSRGFYGSGSYRINKWIEVGGYYSLFYLNWGQDLSDPGNHIIDKAATVRFDLAGHWDLKIEGHSMNGYGATDAFRGFYIQDNPRGFKPDTNLLVIRTGIEF